MFTVLPSTTMLLYAAFTSATGISFSSGSEALSVLDEFPVTELEFISDTSEL